MMWSALGENPVPGDPEAVRRIARLFGSVEDNADRIRQRLAAIGEACGSGIWYGVAADTFHDHCEDLLPDLAKLAKSHSIANEALSTYALALENAQGIARHALTNADDAVTEHDAALRTRDHAEQDRAVAQSHASAAQHALHSIELAMMTALVAGDAAHLAQLKADEQREHGRHVVAVRQADEADAVRRAAEDKAARANVKLQAARQLAADARSLREDAGRRASRELRDASEAGIHNKSLLEQGFETVIAGVKAVTASDLFQSLIEALETVGGSVMFIGWALAKIPIPQVAAVGAVMMAIGSAMVVGALAGRLLSFTVGTSTLGQLGESTFNFALSRIPEEKVLGGMVKRSFAYADNTLISGLAREKLWTRFTVGAKWGLPSQFFLLERTGYQALTAVDVAGFVTDKAREGCRLLKDITDLVQNNVSEAR